MKLRSQRAIAMELRNVTRLIRYGKASSDTYNNLFGAQQALAWCLSDNAMSPMRTYSVAAGRKTAGRKRA